jgi:hypothetical protein
MQWECRSRTFPMAMLLVTEVKKLLSFLGYTQAGAPYLVAFTSIPSGRINPACFGRLRPVIAPTAVYGKHMWKTVSWSLSFTVEARIQEETFMGQRKQAPAVRNLSHVLGMNGVGISFAAVEGQKYFQIQPSTVPPYGL